MAAKSTGAFPSSERTGLEARLLDAVEQAVIATDLQGRILFWSRFAETLFGWSSHEVTGRQVTQVVLTGSEAQRAGEMLSAVSGRGRWQGEPEVTRKDGSSFTASVTGSPLLVDDEVVGMVVVCVDVSEQRRLEEARHSSERQFRTVFESIDEGFCLAEMIVDEHGRARDYRFLEVNPLFGEMTGLVDAAGRTALELVPDLEPFWVDTYARVGLDRQTLRFEQGSAVMGRWFDVFAVPVDPSPRFAIVFKDQTARHLAEEALRESESRFRAMADGLPLLVWQHGPDGSLEWVNQTYCDFFAVDRAEMVAERWTTLTDPESGAVYAADFESAVAGRASFRGQVRVRSAAGKWRWLQSWAEPRYSPDGAYLGHLGVSADVTDRVEAETAARVAAALDAYRARLLDSLREASDPVEIQAMACRLLGEHLGASGVHYAQILQDGRTGVVEAGYDAGGTRIAGTYRLDSYGTAVMDLFRAGQTIVVDDVGHDERLTADERDASLAVGVHAHVMAPFAGPEGPVSALVVHQEQPRHWTPQDLAAIRMTAERTWTAVEQARAYHAALAAHRRAEVIADVVGALEAEPTLAGQLQRLAEALVPRLADFVTVEAPGDPDAVRGVAHRDPGRVETLRALRQHHRLAPRAPGSVSHAAAGEPDLIARIDPSLVAGYALDDETSRLLGDLGPRSTIAVPLHLGDDTPGVLLVGLSEPERPPYTPDDLAFLQEVAHRAEVILSAARLRRREHDIAVRLQQAMLPDHLVQHPRLQVAARYQAAGDMLEVGGDWYDTFTWPTGHIGVIVGDIVGHNLESAAAMGRLRAATAAVAAHVPPDPALLLDAVDRFAGGPNGTDFATAFCVVVDPAGGHLAYASAGHPPALLVEPTGSSRWLDEIQHPPLTTGTAVHAGAELQLTDSSVLILYSDGLVERRTSSLDEGLDRLRTAAVAAVVESRADPETLADHLLHTITADDAIEDDIVLVCLRYQRLG